MQGCIYAIGRFISLLTFLPIHFILVQAQTWCNVEDIQVFGCVIYTGSDEAARQAQGIFAGSNLCMELASEKQVDVSRFLDYISTVVK